MPRIVKRPRRSRTSKKVYSTKTRIHYMRRPRTQVFKLTGVVPISTTNATGGFSRLISLSNPSKYDDLTGTAVAINDWTVVGSLYDSFMVSSIKVTWIPKFFDNQGDATAGGSTFKSIKYGPMYTFVDYDNTNAAMPVSTTDTVVQYENLMVKNPRGMWTRYVKCPRIVGTLGGGWQDIGTPKDVGCLAIYAPEAVNGVISGTVIGDFVVKMYIKFKNRR